MKREIGWSQIQKDTRSLVTVGTFDGVHVAHQSIIKYVVERAAKHGMMSVAVSFDPHPREVVQGVEIPLLTTVEERAREFEQLGIDRFIVIPFTSDFAETGAEDFVINVLVEKIGLSEIVIGHDHGFGKGRQGDKKLLMALGKRYGFTVDVIPVQLLEQDVVSSTRVRAVLLEKGDVQLAYKLLGRNYTLSGEVVTGDGRGAGIGFPTANIQIDHPKKIIPLKGVYAVWVEGEAVEERKRGMLNIGSRPTFNGQDERIEVHMLDFEGDLYGSTLHIEFVQRIRDERKFNSVKELMQQLSKDKERCIAELESVT